MSGFHISTVFKIKIFKICDVIVPDPAPVPLKQRLHEDRHCLGRVLQQEVCANPKHLECRFRRYDWQVIFYKKIKIVFIYCHHLTLAVLE